MTIDKNTTTIRINIRNTDIEEKFRLTYIEYKNTNTDVRPYTIHTNY